MEAAKYILRIRSGDEVVAELPVTGVDVSFQLCPMTSYEMGAALGEEVTQNRYVIGDSEGLEEDSTQGVLFRAKRKLTLSEDLITPKLAPVRSYTPVESQSEFSADDDDERTIERVSPFSEVSSEPMVDWVFDQEDEPTAEAPAPAVSAVSGWEMDEDDPLDSSPLVGFGPVAASVNSHQLRKEPTRWLAWSFGFAMMALLASFVAIFVGIPDSVQEVSSDMVRVTFPPPKPIEKVAQQKKRKASKRRKTPRAKSTPTVPPTVVSTPTAEAQMEEAVAALEMLSALPTTNLNVVSSPSRGGTQTAGVVVKLKPGERVQTGLGQIGVNTEAIATSDKTSAVAATRVARQGRISRAKARDVAVEGSLSKDAIQSVVNGHLGQIRACYERSLLQNPTMRGKIIARWQIGADGRASEVAAAMDSLGDPVTTKCVLSAIRGWQFPSPKGGNVRISYPFNFSSTGA